jgi:DNA-binding response OmpR family regulator
MRVLYVDDHVDTMHLMAKLVSRIGHIVDTATSFQVAKRLCENNQYDLLIVDLGLPDGDGLELLKSTCLEGQPRGVIVSGYAGNDDVKRTHDAGFVHLAKPVTVEQIQGMLANSSRHDQATWIPVQEFKTI